MLSVLEIDVAQTDVDVREWSGFGAGSVFVEGAVRIGEYHLTCGLGQGLGKFLHVLGVDEEFLLVKASRCAIGGKACAGLRDGQVVFALAVGLDIKVIRALASTDACGVDGVAVSWGIGSRGVLDFAHKAIILEATA